MSEPDVAKLSEAAELCGAFPTDILKMMAADRRRPPHRARQSRPRLLSPQRHPQLGKNEATVAQSPH
ncbi:MAG: hypothetical protein K0U78_19155 [Actinomycetia bacterium]|nr:hypothetical protein [Actinomycetes bacterium]